MPRDVIPLRRAVGIWTRVAAQSFGGPAGQIAVMHRTVVDEERLVGERRFLHALNYCMLLPGPEAQQLATYLGWLLNGRVGGVLAGAIFVLPGFVVMMVLSVLYTAFGDTRIVTAVFAGIAPAILAIVLQAVQRISKRALLSRFLVGVAVASFVGIYVLRVPFPVIVIGALVLGYVIGTSHPHLIPEAKGHQAADGPAPLIADDVLHHARASSRRAAVILAVGLTLWFAPVALAWATFGRDSVFVQQGLFFSFTAVVTFGGAYAVLSYVGQRAVSFGWVTPNEVLYSLALGETTPGPLIQLVQFIAFLGAYRNPGSLNPWVAGVLGSLITVWVTYVPCFLWIFLGAPYVERLRANRRLSSALTAVTAAVVGVIVNLALFFFENTLFDDVNDRSWGPFHLAVPQWSTFSWTAGVTAVLSGVLLFRFKWSVLRVLGACVVVGGGLHLAFG